MIIFILLSTLILTFYYFILFDFKKIIALSSILHLNLSLISLFTLSSISYLTLIINSISHGINAFYAFLLFGFMINKNYSRFIDSLFFITFINRILIFIFILFNISFPLSFNFIVELLSLIILINISLFLSFIFIIISFISTLYYFLLFNRKITFNFNFIQFNIIELIYCLLFICVIFYYGVYFLF
jgi:NADH:ubiquinone oxidoreductase subunit 4 (subunit M)